ncbi:helix-turn-helix transcriptional regulator [Mycolicibacterium sp. 624]|uniref:helix-turn-helix domain-containing protein n=1 Tax=Mycolicibacterium sp. 624 TaxID=3156314 RepID=UPI0033910FB1
MPTRPSQTDPHRAELWARRRLAVGLRIRTLRLQQGLTQEALALQSGVTRNVLINVEHGKRGLLFELLFDLADALGVPVSDLFEELGEPKLPNMAASRQVWRSLLTLRDRRSRH